VLDAILPFGKFLKLPDFENLAVFSAFKKNPLLTY
jgi:hypothetical protein